MAKIKYYSWAIPLIIIFLPFFIIGMFFGQFVGVFYHGYKDGRKWMLNFGNELQRKMNG